MSNFDPEHALERVAYFNGKKLSISAFGTKDSSSIPSATQTERLFRQALNIGFDELLLHGCYYTYEEPDYATVEPWITGLERVEKKDIQRIIIACGEDYAMVGNIDSLVSNSPNLKELFVFGLVDVHNIENMKLERLSLKCDRMSFRTAENIGKANCPMLRYLAIGPSGAGDVPERGFGKALIESMCNNSSMNINELVIHHSGNSEQIIEHLCESKYIDKLKLLQLADSELCEDPEDTIELLTRYLNQLSKVQILRLPLNGLMDDERESIKLSIPNLVDSTQPYPDPPSWHFPFHSDKYGLDEFEAEDIMRKEL